MKKLSAKKLHLGKIKVADLSKVNANEDAFMLSLRCVPSEKITCLSQGSPMCSADICLF
ncbi:MAG: hypothetical protein J7623_28025 [Chitinophaga sp.]|uniref:hypothetical protein n=1 Tax=Chitinophaga sp. TaxID=1869181 RepID=UPI001B091F6E|nr:hypothetical protein [Chitinophaga sp.]MBO9732523.1 hypothetical protein [Chitinophaga sp.]